MQLIHEIDSSVPEDRLTIMSPRMTLLKPNNGAQDWNPDPIAMAMLLNL